VKRDCTNVALLQCKRLAIALLIDIFLFFKIQPYQSKFFDNRRTMRSRGGSGRTPLPSRNNHYISWQVSSCEAPLLPFSPRVTHRLRRNRRRLLRSQATVERLRLTGLPPQDCNPCKQQPPLHLAGRSELRSVGLLPGGYDSLSSR
jgi:hypothetical protein